MKSLILILITSCLVVSFNTCAFAKAKPSSSKTHKIVKPITTNFGQLPKNKIKPSPFRVTRVEFKLGDVNNKYYLAAIVYFNKEIDKSTVIQNSNIRLLRKDAQNFWRDASTQNNTVKIYQNFITWVCGESITNDVYVMQFRGTIKSADGVYLDCNNDGIGEGGNLPALKSQPYQLRIPVEDLGRFIPFEN